MVYIHLQFCSLISSFPKILWVIKMQNPEDHHSDREIISPSYTTKSNDDKYVEVTLDIRDDTVAVHSVKNATKTKAEEAEIEALGKNLQKKRSFGATIVRNLSKRLRSQPHPPRTIDRSSTAAQNVLKGFKFISRTDGGSGWDTVQQRFDELTANSDSLLPKAKFGECIGKRIRVLTDCVKVIYIIKLPKNM